MNNNIASRNQTPATRTFASMAIVTLILFLPMTVNSASADEEQPWAPSGKIVMPNAEPLKIGYCPVWVDMLCGWSAANAGAAIGFDGDQVAVGDPHHSSVHFFSLVDALWLPSETFAGPEGFGESIAMRGDTAVVGAPKEATAHVFTRNNGSWELATVLSEADGGCLARAVAIQGSTIVLGDPCNEKVHVYVTEDDAWIKTETLEIQDTSSFGHSVAISEGSIFIGSSESVFAARANGQQWEYIHIDTVKNVDVAASGNTVAVGSPGFVRIYDYNDEQWSLSDELYPERSMYGEGNSFGWAIDYVGDTLVVGSAQDHSFPDLSDDPDEAEDMCISQAAFRACIPQRPGAVYVFSRTSHGDWNPPVKLTGDPIGHHRFGTSVALGSGEQTIMAGAPYKWQDTQGGIIDVDPENSVHVFSKMEG